MEEGQKSPVASGSSGFQGFQLATWANPNPTSCHAESLLAISD